MKDFLADVVIRAQIKHESIFLKTILNVFQVISAHVRSAKQHYICRGSSKQISTACAIGNL